MLLALLDIPKLQVDVSPSTLGVDGMGSPTLSVEEGPTKPCVNGYPVTLCVEEELPAKLSIEELP